MSDAGDGEIVAGGALGVLALTEAAAGFAVCPLCVIGAPILIGIGVYRRISARKKAED